MLNALLPAETFAFLLVFCRVGAAFMLLPGIGEAYVPMRIRLALTLLLCFVVTPMVARGLPAPPDSAGAVALLVAGETAMGILIGGAARLALSALQVAGTVIAFQSSLGFGSFYDPTQGGQSAIIASFLSLTGITAIFAADLHHLTIRAAAESYMSLPPLTAIPVGAFAEIAGQMTAESFRVGIQIAAPFLVYGVVFNIGLGALNRLMPAVQVTFIAMPIQIALAFVLLAATIGVGVMWFLEYYAGAIGRLAGG